jgi:hypothetical protein
MAAALVAFRGDAYSEERSACAVPRKTRPCPPANQRK